MEIQGMPQNQNLIYQAIAVAVAVTVVVETATVAAVAVVGEVAEVAPRNLQQMLK